ncbi:tyrosine-type recombinase/integrase [Silvibacterium dinghuense]|uniref:Site-specific integrase n=1 Tax=Silvibacterium dinghuense TaxID=1560006 RepID=A0A4Q1SDX9_9BACT|nr:site-specific integrase [Silvibacterium dinghuense]RXS95118.1 site-specific integrase [Silvibacterium dinghuense]GGH10784.1 hypothetical protein GCM10011586_29280 [Silvibacterium dinghuense]
MSIARYQEGNISRVSRAKGPDVWVYRYRATENGERVHKSRVLGTVKDYKTKAEAKRAADNIRCEVNAAEEQAGKLTVARAWGHFQEHELHDPDIDRSPTTIRGYLEYFPQYILPKWAEMPVDEVKAVAVEKWLRSLDLAPATKSKIRNLMSSLFSHLIRHELLKGENVMRSVRQGSKRVKIPEVLDLGELQALVREIKTPHARAIVLTAAATGLRRSEIQGLQWQDLDFENNWINLRRGYVDREITKLKTEQSRKGIPMLPELAAILKEWREQTPYPREEDWIFASPAKQGKAPYWLIAVFNAHVQPAADRAKIRKRIGWHTFRHSFGTLLKANGEDVKTIQELLRHANSRITLEVYTQGNTEAKRSALNGMSGLFVVAKTA